MHAVMLATDRLSSATPMLLPQMPTLAFNNVLRGPMSPRIAEHRLLLNSGTACGAFRTQLVGSTLGKLTPMEQPSHLAQTAEDLQGQRRTSNAHGSGRRQSVRRPRRRSGELPGIDCNKPGALALYDAVSDGDIDAVREALASGILVDVEDDHGCTALIMACEGEPLIVEELLARGAEVNHQSHDGTTALMTAVKYEDENIVGQVLACPACASTMRKPRMTFARAVACCWSTARLRG